ncbi:Transcriptional regulator [metagenome]|uniref:Transcriptional regulator n=1 Tax=metagenome TaxID=256318 RepID=A0A2P2CFJ2_9ZZZZ
MTKPTINDVARLAGVSKGAVSFAFNNRPGISTQTRERILAAAAELGWSPSRRARALSVSRSLAVGLVMARPPETLRADPFFPSFIAGVEGELSRHGYALLLQIVAEHESEHDSYRRLASEGRVDGVLLTDLHVDDDRPALLAELGLPAVIVGPNLGEAFWPAVGVDDGPGVTAAVEHLLALGHTRIAHVAGPGDLVHGKSRRAAWARTLEKAGLPEGDCIETDFSAEEGAKATRTLLDLAQAPTAIVFANDLMAIAGLAVAVGRGIDVPGRLSIIGYEDTELAAHMQPPLTTVSTDVIGWGRAAAGRLLALIQDRPRLLALIQDRPAGDLDLQAPRLVVRGSTASPAPG